MTGCEHARDSGMGLYELYLARTVGHEGAMIADWQMPRARSGILHSLGGGGTSTPTSLRSITIRRKVTSNPAASIPVDEGPQSGLRAGSPHEGSERAQRCQEEVEVGVQDEAEVGGGAARVAGRIRGRGEGDRRGVHRRVDYNSISVMQLKPT